MASRNTLRTPRVSSQTSSHNVQGGTVLRLACSARSIWPCLFGAYNVQGNTVLRLACSARSIGPCLFGAYITSKARIQSCAWRDENAPPTSANVSGEPITGREYGALKGEPITGRVIGAVCLSERVYKSSSRSAVRVLHSRPQSRGGRAGRDGAPTNHTLSRSPRSVYAGRLCVWRVVNGISLAISIIFIWFSTFISLH